MRLTPPAMVTWIIAVVIGVIGIMVHQHALRLPGVGIDAFWLVTAAFVLLAAAPLVRGL